MRLFRNFTKRGQTGQSLVILAIGFLALLGFVGIVTDVSVLFIRYSTLRRAIDAAAIAAAGQMRRVADDDGDAFAQGEAMSVANLNLAARQFIEVYGLNPKSVIVETCRAQQVGRDGSGNPVDADGEPLFLSTGGDNPAANAETIAHYRELCTNAQLKLVRVTAQIDAPTIFLRLLGYPTVTLTESAISQTAVLDVVMVFDVSESMLNETTYSDWDTLTPPQGVRYIPTFVNYSRTGEEEIEDTDPQEYYPMSAWEMLTTNTQNKLDLWSGTADDSGGNPINLPYPDYYYSNDLIANPNAQPVPFWDMTLKYETGSTLGLGTLGLQEYTNESNSPIGRREPRQFCRVRAYPSASAARVEVPRQYRYEISDYLTNVYPVLHPAVNPGDYAPTYNTKVFTNPTTTDPAQRAYYLGFVPMYDFHGCCNDPNGDFNFGDLVCQPFKAARNAAEDFLSRLDFLRGDRVGFVTFNREAYLVDPDGVEADGGGPQPYMIETERNYTDPVNSVNNRRGAVETLRSVVGVMAEASHYGDINHDGYWDSLVDGYGNIETLRPYSDFGSIPIGEIIKHPVANSCPFDKAVLNPPYLMPNERVLPDGSQRTQKLLSGILTVPGWYMTSGIPSASVDPGFNSHIRNYEYKASCAGTNIGGALAGGSQMLWQEGRREGAVWIMVLLSDGAAGASNPIYTIQGDTILPADPYNVESGRIVPQAGSGGVIQGQSGQGGYGYFGLCPYGEESNPSQLLRANSFPNCGDLQPEIRHYCGNVASPPGYSVDASGTPISYSVLDADNFAAADRCIDYYDVDDYARDWADWVGLAQLPGATISGLTGRVNDQLLPTIFTIGFGLNYDDGTVADCSTAWLSVADQEACMRGNPAFPAANDSDALRRDRNADYLGEELLRYIADVGDNFQIDSDYWQLCASQTRKPSDPLFIDQTSPCLMPGFQNLENRINNFVYLSSTSPNWGVRGPCEEEWTGNPLQRGNVYMPMSPVTSCGNYFAAPSGDELQVVFNQIASRMFTRLSQ